MHSSRKDMRSIASRRAGEIRIKLPPQSGLSSQSFADATRLPRIDQYVPQCPHLFEGAARAERNAAERVVSNRYRETGGVPNDQVEIGEQGTPASQHNALIDDVGGEFGRRVLERDLDGLDDRTDRFGEAFGDLPFADHNFLRHAVHQVAALYLHHSSFAVL